MKTILLAGVAGLSVFAFAGAAQAQDSVPQEEASGGLGDIVVTARRSAESLQSVPVAVSALGGDFIERQNISSAADVPRFTPNLTIEQQPSSLSAATVYIRGIGNQEPSAVSEQGVGLYLDGVYLARSAGSVFEMMDLERIEVLRGPQGTLFGRTPSAARSSSFRASLRMTWALPPRPVSAASTNGTSRVASIPATSSAMC